MKLISRLLPNKPYISNYPKEEATGSASAWPFFTDKGEMRQ